MKFHARVRLAVLCSLALVGCSDPRNSEQPQDPSLLLWYDEPAENWNEALPIGNGRLGAMIYGGADEAIIQFNEETLWTGQPHDYAHQGAHEVLDDLRQALWDGRQAEAHQLAMERFMSEPLGQQAYQPFGSILLTFPGHDSVTNYRRSLDLQNALSAVAYDVDGVTFKRESFASNPAQAIITHISASRKESLNFSISMGSPHEEYEIQMVDDQLILRGKANDYAKERQRKGMPYPESLLAFEARLKLTLDGGSFAIEDKSVKVTNANSATLKLVAATSFVNYNDISGDPTKKCLEHLSELDGTSFTQLREQHIADYTALFDRVDISLGAMEGSERPADERLASFATDSDPSMVALLFQYGRYLLISSSRPGTQPANLQGIWNDQLVPPWDSKYTININAEMNYWPAEITGLSELTEPLIQLVEELAESGQSTAKAHYNLNGWVAHHNTDLWRGAAPINHANHGIWVTGGAWLSQHLWWHYEFTGDVDFLRDRAYPVLKEASRFFAGYLVPDPTQPEWLVSGPSNSPENGGLVMAPTMDHQIIRALFTNTIEAAEVLQADQAFADMIQGKRDSIAPNLIGQFGQLQEWLEDKDDPDNKHRHVSHLWGLHPGNEIHPLITPELAEACKVTLSQRGDGGTGWSLAWKINFWARLLDGDHSFALVRNLISPAVNNDDEGLPSVQRRGGLYNNLLDAHPPFQIDGNFGATSGITEMLLQSHLRDNEGNYIQDILPALPAALPTGKVSGLVGRGGFTHTISWEDGALTSIEVTSRLGNQLTIRHQSKTIVTPTEKGQILSLARSDFQ